MLNITQIVLASVNILNTSRYFAYVWGIEWFYKHFNYIGHVWYCMYFCTDAMVKYINVIMCIERWVACKFPLKYKSLCTKGRIYRAVICCALWATIPQYTMYFILRGPKPPRPCGDTFGWLLYSLYRSKRFKKEKCLDVWKDYKLGFSKTMQDIFEHVIQIGTFAIIPLVLLLVFGILTLRALRQSGPPKAELPSRAQWESQAHSNALESSLSDTIIAKRKARNKKLTKLVLGLVFVNILFSLTHLFELLYRIENDYRIKIGFGGKQMNKMLGFNVDSCAKRAFHLLMTLIFSINPILYIMYNEAVNSFWKWNYNHKELFITSCTYPFSCGRGRSQK